MHTLNSSADGILKRIGQRERQSSTEFDRVRHAARTLEGARKRWEKGHARYAAQADSERQATSQWKITHRAETPEERETRNGSSAIRHFKRGDEDVME